MSLARKNVTSDHFLIYHFYELLAKEVERLGITNRPGCIWSCDKSSFSSDPSKCNHDGPKG